MIYKINGFYVTNEGTKSSPLYHVWIPGITCATADSAYKDLSCAIARCKYLNKAIKNPILSSIHN